MKKLSLLVLAAISLTSCWTSIFTVAPTVEPVAPPKTVYTTTVTTPKTTTVTTVTVTNYNSDPCFYLDLNAVAAAFAESHSVREFEEILNSSRYMINNLDLNRDGWIDYLRVIETSRGYYHTLLIQACLAPSVFQDVATLIAERRADALYVEVVGDRYLYGYNYIVRPVFIKRPPLYDSYGHPRYTAWVSPYYYGYFPSYYTQPKPIYLNHYQAYVNTYMTNHHYCHHCDYPNTVFYSGYTDMTQQHRRNDYGAAHPDQSFEQRVTRTASATNGVSVRNAGQLRNSVAKSSESTKTTTTTSGTSSSTRSTSTSASSTKTATSTTSGSARSTNTATTTKKVTPTNQPNTTTVNTRVNTSGTTRTTVRTTDSTGRTSTSTRSTSTAPARSSSTQTRSTGSSTRSSQDKKTESSPRSSQRGR
ncbi:MAG: hypothetical protein IKM83_05040 [Paludibacteraceae bacterium]|nr:hypothetical protein [Paludibacteraceae bacterium]